MGVLIICSAEGITTWLSCIICSFNECSASREKTLLAEISRLKDALRCLKQLSLYIQSKAANVMNAVDYIHNVREKLLAMKQENGQKYFRIV